MAEDPCPLCRSKLGLPVKILKRNGSLEVNCDVCGKFKLEEEAYDDFLAPKANLPSRITQAHGYRLAHKIYQANMLSNSVPFVTSEPIENFLNDNSYLGPSPAKQLDNLIRYVGNEVLKKGESIKTIPNLFVIIGSSSPSFCEHFSYTNRI